MKVFIISDAVVSQRLESVPEWVKKKDAHDSRMCNNYPRTNSTRSSYT